MARANYHQGPGPTFRDQYTPAEEAAMEAGQAESEDRDDRERTCPGCGGQGCADCYYAGCVFDRTPPQIVGAAEEEMEHEPCPMGCGRTTGDPYGGPCKACWDKAK